MLSCLVTVFYASVSYNTITYTVSWCLSIQSTNQSMDDKRTSNKYVERRTVNAERCIQYSSQIAGPISLITMQSFHRCTQYLRRGLVVNQQYFSALQYSPISNYHQHFHFSTQNAKPDKKNGATTIHKQPHEGTAYNEPMRLAKLIATQGTNMQMSRRSADMLIGAGQVTLAGELLVDPSYKISIKDAYNGIKVSGRLLRLPDLSPKKIDNPRTSMDNDTDPFKNREAIVQPMRTRVWLAHKLAGELVSEHDPKGRPSLIERLERGGVGKPKKGKKKNHQQIHLKAVGRLDMITEGLILITNDGQYKREMELPSNILHRTYRVRVHGRVTPGKLNALRNGVNINGNFYKGMKVNIETNKGNRAKGGNTNMWLRITCVEGKNRQIRRTLDYLGLKVTRLIRISFGDYDLNTIPPGLAIEVPVKSLDSQKKRGRLVNKAKPPQKKRALPNENTATPVQWIRHQ